MHSLFQLQPKFWRSRINNLKQPGVLRPLQIWFSFKCLCHKYFLSHIFKNLNENHNCKSLGTPVCFQIIDSASSKFRLKPKERMHITWTKSSLNRQLKRMSISITVWNCFALSLLLPLYLLLHFYNFWFIINLLWFVTMVFLLFVTMVSFRKDFIDKNV